MSQCKPVEAQEPSHPGAFEEWYETKFKHGFERGPNDKYVARMAWLAALYAHPPKCARCEELQAKLAAAEKDAARYRWLVTGKRRSYVANNVLSDSKLEDAIDAAIAEKKVEKS